MYGAKLAGTGFKVFGDEAEATDDEPLVLVGEHEQI